MKKKLLVTAIAGTLAAPMVMAQSGPDVTVYARINNALDIQDVDGGDLGDGDTTTDIRNVSSRFGIKGSSDLGNGLTAIGRYEFATFTDVEGDRPEIADADGNIIAAPKTKGGVADTRLGYVGLSGGFGTVTVGNQWSSYYNSVGSHIDPTYSLGAFLYSTVAAAPYRSSNTIKYANALGPVNAELDLRFSQDTEPPKDVERLGRDHGEDFLDGFGLGLSAPIGPVTLGLAYDKDQYDTADDDDRLGAAIKGTFGNFYGILGYQELDPGDKGVDREQTQVWFGGNITPDTSFLLGYGQGEVGPVEPEQIMWGVYHKVGGGLRLYYEASDVDTDVGGVGWTQHLLGMRYDF